jgi:pimeloyl-ACP methyl ester carboxylesterase
MPPLKTSIIFVAGAWHTEFHLQPITPYLEAYGYRVVPVKLRTSEGNQEPPPTVQENVQHVKSIIKAEIDAGYSVYLVGHSLSGQSVAAAAGEFLATASPSEAAKIVHIVFIACFLNPTRAMEGADWFTLDFTTLNATLKSPYESFYNSMTREAAAPFVTALDSCRAQPPPEHISDLWKTQVKGTYFLCKNDTAVLPERQRPEAEDCGMRLVELEADHCPFVSQPREFADELHTVLRAA